MLKYVGIVLAVIGVVAVMKICNGISSVRKKTDEESQRIH